MLQKNAPPSCCAQEFGSGWTAPLHGLEGGYRYCEKSGTKTEYYWCTSSDYCGWNGCRNPNHGVELYQVCWHY